MLQKYWPVSDIEILYSYKHLKINKFKVFRNQLNLSIFDKNKSLNRDDDYVFLSKVIGLIMKKGLKTRYKLILFSIVDNFNLNIHDKFFKLNFIGLIDIFYNFIKKNLFIFFFNFHKINKNIRRYSRGRSGKYKVVFKYVPVFKRLKCTLKIFFRELTFHKNNFKSRLEFIIVNSLTKPKKSFLFRLKKLTYYKIFTRFKNSLFIKSN